MDTILLVAIILGLFIVYELYSGEVPLRYFGSIRRDARPFFYWISILFHGALLVVVIYAYMDGLRLPLSDFFDGLFD